MRDSQRAFTLWNDERLNILALLEELRVNRQHGPYALYAWSLGEDSFIEDAISILERMESE